MNALVNPIGAIEMLVNFLPAVWRAVNRGGIELWGLRYWHEDLAGHVGCGEPQLVHYDPRDITRVYVRAPDGLLRECKLLTEGVGRMSLIEWRKTRKASPDDPSLIALRDLGVDKKEEVERRSVRATRAARRDAAREEERSRGAAASHSFVGGVPPQTEPTVTLDGPVPVFEANFLNPKQTPGETHE
jgi:putative transposase